MAMLNVELILSQANCSKQYCDEPGSDAMRWIGAECVKRAREVQGAKRGSANSSLCC